MKYGFYSILLLLVVVTTSCRTATEVVPSDDEAFEISAENIGDRYVRCVFNDNAYVILKIGAFEGEYVLIGPKECVSLGEYWKSNRVEIQELSEETSLVSLVYTGGSGTGVHFEWRLLILLPNWGPPKYVRVFDSGYVSNDWDISESERSVTFEGFELIDGDKQVKLTYALHDGDQDAELVEAACDLTLDLSNEYYAPKVMSFLGFEE